MFGINNILKLFRNRKSSDRRSTPKELCKELVEFGQEKIEKDGWLELAEAPEDSDYLVIPKDDKPNKILRLSEDLELIAKREAYRLAIPSTDEDSQAILSEQKLAEKGYTLKRLGTDASNSKGVYVYALVNEKNPDAPITVVCRGTYLDASILADLDPQSPGYAALQADMHNIKQELNNLCNEYPNKKLRITGHSLGGSLSQILTTDILEEKSKGKESSFDGIANITGIDTVIFQAAGVTEELAESAALFAKKVKEQDESFDINFIAHVKEGDLVPNTGTYLFSDIDPSIADVTLILKELNKPIITMGDFSDIGFAAATTCSPVWVAFTAIRVLAMRQLVNRLEAHSDYFHHDEKGKIIEACCGIYRNSTEEDRLKIKAIFERDDVSMIPYSKEITAFLHGCFEDLETNDLKSMFTSIKGLASCFSSAISIGLSGLKGTVQAMSSVAQHSDTLSSAVSDVREHFNQASTGFLKLYNAFRNKVSGSQKDDEYFPPSKQRHAMSVTPMF